ncbi:anthranilate synthase/phosphoribosyltransferase [Hathewaya proteolytica DSM 3090]|uniref:Anthranilate phosphoribosyltransferase n=1 Tax=Hathewaya proteolytica DSM 3090 TaxID=1121331 RepID=A0A1M6K6X2_9CLOT|nr:bifunctional anthranilate synthase component II/anthranilate phosphoribosyltransferase [Hathewaya proteolytica]SHJ54593.1 anthranilate synthase/phosphoribosyltransferase [Hathewaya proteolytica DSM 3090]
MILIIDNYDSFTYNLYQYFGEIYKEVQVVKNDKITIDEIEKMCPSAIVFSPGPGRPEDTGICREVIAAFKGKIPMLGICIGHQLIGQYFGAKVIQSDKIVHGKISMVNHNGNGIFSDVKSPMKAMRYHSLIVDRSSIPQELQIIAEAEDGTVMGLKHREYNIYGVQFHPESILTEDGKKIIKNFLEGLQMCKNFKEYTEKLLNREDLSREESRGAMKQIMSGKLTESEMGSFLACMRMKGETEEEILGFVEAIKGYDEEFDIQGEYAIDTCGTGGDGGKTFNISTVVAIIAASAGIKVAKHGNRAVSGKSGSADVLAALGIDIQMPEEQSMGCFHETNMTFLFAPQYHKAMKNVAQVRKNLGFRTIFNMLGPIINPAPIKGQIMGIYDGRATEIIAKVLSGLGRERTMVVHGDDGLDEISLSAGTKITELRDGKIRTYHIEPEDFGFQKVAIEEVAGGSAEDNSKIILDILKGEKGAKRDIVVLNAAAALYVGKKVGDLKEGVQMAEELIDSGKAYECLNKMVRYHQSVKVVI